MEGGGTVRNFGTIEIWIHIVMAPLLVAACIAGIYYIRKARSGWVTTNAKKSKLAGGLSCVPDGDSEMYNCQGLVDVIGPPAFSGVNLDRFSSSKDLGESTFPVQYDPDQSTFTAARTGAPGPSTGSSAPAPTGSNRVPSKISGNVLNVRAWTLALSALAFMIGLFAVLMFLFRRSPMLQDYEGVTGIGSVIGSSIGAASGMR